jgi:uncharacterized membrane protein
MPQSIQILHTFSADGAIATLTAMLLALLLEYGVIGARSVPSRLSHQARLLTMLIAPSCSANVSKERYQASLSVRLLLLSKVEVSCLLLFS